MKICDRCKSPVVSIVLLDKRSGSEYDLCKKCADDFSEFLAPQEIKQEPLP